jgi:hypothetical protein
LKGQHTKASKGSIHVCVRAHALVCQYEVYAILCILPVISDVNHNSSHAGQMYGMHMHALNTQQRQVGGSAAGCCCALQVGDARNSAQVELALKHEHAATWSCHAVGLETLQALGSLMRHTGTAGKALGSTAQLQALQERCSWAFDGLWQQAAQLQQERLPAAGTTNNEADLGVRR